MVTSDKPSLFSCVYIYILFKFFIYQWNVVLRCMYSGLFLNEHLTASMRRDCHCTTNKSGHVNVRVLRNWPTARHWSRSARLLISWRTVSQLSLKNPSWNWFISVSNGRVYPHCYGCACILALVIMVIGCKYLWSASQLKLIVPRYRRNSFGRRCFAVAGPSTWNSLPDSLRDPASNLLMFRRQLKTYFFCEILTRCTQHIRDLLIMCYINLHFTYLLTYCGLSANEVTLQYWDCEPGKTRLKPVAGTRKCLLH